MFLTEAPPCLPGDATDANRLGLGDALCILKILTGSRTPR